MFKDVLVPGVIEASAGIRFGEPVLDGTRIPVEALASHVLAGDSQANVAADYGISEQQVMAAVCFQAGVNWQRSRGRRQHMEQAVKDYWKERVPGGPISPPI